MLPGTCSSRVTVGRINDVERLVLCTGDKAVVLAVALVRILQFEQLAYRISLSRWRLCLRRLCRLCLYRPSCVRITLSVSLSS